MTDSERQWVSALQLNLVSAQRRIDMLVNVVHALAQLVEWAGPQRKCLHCGNGRLDGHQDGCWVRMAARGASLPLFVWPPLPGMVGRISAECDVEHE